MSSKADSDNGTSPSGKMLPPKDYNVLEEHLNNIMKTSITLSNTERANYNAQLRKVLDQFLEPEMRKQDPLFNCLYKHNVYSGSAYENLKISKPNEFDLNLVLELPTKEVKIHASNNPGFVRVHVEFDDNQMKSMFREYSKGEEKIKTWLDKKGYLCTETVLNWLQSVVQRTKSSLSIDNMELNFRKSGPAITIEVKWPQDGNITGAFSVDLVPVFVYGNKEWPAPPVRQPTPNQVSQKWCVVPKGPHDVKDVTLWRMSFYEQERPIMNGYDNLKFTLKLIKLLRDARIWASISSYYIKTMFLWEHEKQSFSKEFWRQGRGYLFIYMLRRLESLLRSGGIPFYWDKRCNLLSHRKKIELSGFAGQINNIVKDIEKNLVNDPACVLKYFERSTTPVVQESPQKSPDARVREREPNPDLIRSKKETFSTEVVMTLHPIAEEMVPDSTTSKADDISVGMKNQWSERDRKIVNELNVFRERADYEKELYELKKEVLILQKQAEEVHLKAEEAKLKYYEAVETETDDFSLHENENEDTGHSVGSTEDVLRLERPRKRVYTREDRALSVMNDVCSAISSKQANEHSAFGDYVAHELCSLKDPRALLLLKKEISDAIFKTKLAALPPSPETSSSTNLTTNWSGQHVICASQPSPSASSNTLNKQGYIFTTATPVEEATVEIAGDAWDFDM